MGIERMRYSLQVEFVDYGKHGLHCHLYIRKDRTEKIANTPPQPADLEICLELLGNIAKSFEIPEHETIGLSIQLESIFRERFGESRQMIVAATPFDELVIEATSPIAQALVDRGTAAARRK